MTEPATPSPLRGTLNERLNEAVVAYAALADLHPDDWGDTTVVAELNESRTLDPSGLTTFLLLRGLLATHAATQQFTAADLLRDPAGVLALVTRINTVRTLIHDPEVDTALTALHARLRQTAQRLAVPATTDFEAFLADTDLLGRVYRDVRRSLRDLRPVQFLQGDPATAPLQVNAQIFEFWNINSLIAALAAQRVDGATLCLIRDPEHAMASYFVFALRHGGTLTVVSDYEPGAHPLHDQMSRRPDRSLENRANRHWFPYDLLDLSRDRSGRLSAADRQALVPYQHQMAPIATLGSLSPAQLTWAFLVLDGLVATYGRAHHRLPALAYTAEMLVRPLCVAASPSAERPALPAPAGPPADASAHAAVDLPVDSTATPAVAVVPYVPLALPPLTHETVTHAALAPQLDEPAVGHNEWMITRFAAQVPDVLLTPVGDRDAAQLAVRHGRLLTPLTTPRAWSSRAERVTLEAIRPTRFGSAEEIAADRLWLARVNQARVVQVLADREFARERPAVERWCRDRLAAQLPVLVDAAARGTWILPSVTPAVDVADPDGPSFPHGTVTGEADVVRQVLVTTRRDLPSLRAPFVLGTVDEAARTAYRCPVSHQAASVFTIFQPTGGHALAVLLGVPFDTLPVGLQQWTARAPYVGNSILDRLDPADWVLRNPWAALSMQIVLPLSRTAFKAARVRLGLPADAAILTAAPRSTAR